jgi:phosphoglycerate dehydrogenase-like enzyme
MENVILTPHIAGASPQYLRRAMEIIRHNLNVYISRVGQMTNVVDPMKGY